MPLRLHLVAPVLLPLLLAACQTVPDQAGFTQGQVAVLKANGFRQIGDNWELGLSDRLLFATDQSGLVPRQLERLGELSRALDAVGIRGAKIEGNTDSTGAAHYNTALSRRRAEAVKAALIGAGMSAGRVRTEALGESNPIESNNTAAGRQENRRVVIVVSPSDSADYGELSSANEVGR